MKTRHKAMLDSIFAHPVSRSIRSADIEALFLALGAEVTVYRYDAAPTKRRIVNP